MNDKRDLGLEIVGKIEKFVGDAEAFLEKLDEPTTFRKFLMKGLGFAVLSNVLSGCRGAFSVEVDGPMTVMLALERSRVVEFQEIDAGLTTGQSFRGIGVIGTESERYPFYKGRGEQLLVLVNDRPIAQGVEHTRAYSGDIIDLRPEAYQASLAR